MAHFCFDVQPEAVRVKRKSCCDSFLIYTIYIYICGEVFLFVWFICLTCGGDCLLGLWRCSNLFVCLPDGTCDRVGFLLILLGYMSDLSVCLTDVWLGLLDLWGCSNLFVCLSDQACQSWFVNFVRMCIWFVCLTGEVVGIAMFVLLGCHVFVWQDKCRGL